LDGRIITDTILAQTTIADLVQISPEDIEKPSGESIEDNINAKYANKVDLLFL
jgi:DNA-directed RNA polymerase subunit E'/Rpb7